MLDQQATPAANRVSRRWPLISGVVVVGLALVLAVLLVQRDSLPFGIDRAWTNELFEERLPFLEWFSFGMNWLGGGIVGVIILPVSIVVVLLIVRRPWAALYFAIVSLASAGAVQLLKSLIGRERPENILIHADFGSFPSGHSANAATMAVALGIIFPRLWVLAAGAIYTALMMFSRTYLGAHWLTDTIGGVLLGAGVALLIWAPFAAKLSSETGWRRDPIAAHRSPGTA